VRHGYDLLSDLVENNLNTLPSGRPNILLLGASGGLGGALAAHYAQAGSHLILLGRNTERLEELAQQCRVAGSTAEIQLCDLMQVEQAVSALNDLDRRTPIDVAVFAAGQGDVRPAGSLVESAELVQRLGTVNFVAQAAMAAALGERMAVRDGGKIVLVGSAASFHALPFAAAYSGSKAGLTRFADALRIGLGPHGVSVTLVSPGFIDTAAARQVSGPKPMMMSPADAARRIADATEKGLAHVIMPWPFALLRLLDRMLPHFLKDRLLRSLAPPAD